MSWAWRIWLALIAASFAILERYALRNNKLTLSRFVWLAQKAWPPLAFFVGLVVGFLADHFFWPGQACDLFK